MIAALTGTWTTHDSKLIVTVQGVGYLVSVSKRLLAQAASRSGQTLFIYSHIKEDAFDLYGFETWQERTLFLLILSVSGIGPATAISILDYELSSVVTAIQEADVAFFTKIPRIGKKVAQKIIIELGSKLGEVKSLELGPQSQTYLEIQDSLTALGFKESDVLEALRSFDLEKQSADTVIKAVIKQLGAKK